MTYLQTVVSDGLQLYPFFMIFVMKSFFCRVISFNCKYSTYFSCVIMYIIMFFRRLYRCEAPATA